jgi:hypothetical protein
MSNTERSGDLRVSSPTVTVEHIIGEANRKERQWTRETTMDHHTTIPPDQTMAPRALSASAGALMLFLGLVSAPGSAQAVPVHHPDKCPDQMPAGGFNCLTGGGKLLCTNDGDVMCCKPNSQGGQDCEQIEALRGPKNFKGNVGNLSGGQLQVAPGSPPPRTAPVPKAGLHAPIMRRGLEGDVPAPEPTVHEEQGK